MNVTQWCAWFIQQRLRLHNILCERLADATDWEQRFTELYEHDQEVHLLACHVQKRIARANLVTVLAQREKTQ